MISRSVIQGAGIAGILAVLCITSVASTAHAGTGLTIQPIKISQTMKPGERVSGQILLSNASTDDTIVEMSIEDFVPTAGSDTFQFVGRAPGVSTVRDWIKFDDSKLIFNFKQGDSRYIPYTITAPATAEPGSHFGVLFFKATRAADADLQIKVGTRVGVLVFVTIPGKFEQKGTMKSFSAPLFVQGGPVPFQISFENTGTVHFEPKGLIDIKNMFGSKIASVPIEGFAVLPTGVKDMHFVWNVSGWLLGRYVATASVFDTDGNLLSMKSTVFYAFPIWYILGFLITLLILFFIIRWAKTRFKFSVSLKK